MLLLLLLLLLLLPDVVQNDTGSPNWKQPSEHWNAKPFKALIPPRFGWRYGASSDGGLKSKLRLQDQQYFQHFGCLLSSDELTVETRNEWTELLAVVSMRSPKQKRKVSAANSTDIEKDTRQNKRKNSNETKRNETKRLLMGELLGARRFAYQIFTSHFIKPRWSIFSSLLADSASSDFPLFLSGVFTVRKIWQRWNVPLISRKDDGIRKKKEKSRHIIK